MKLQFKITLIFWLWAVNAHSQNKYGTAWVMGLSYGYIISFNNNNTINTKIINNNQFVGVNYNSSICDNNGNPLLIFDGLNLYDSNLNYIDSGKQLVFNHQYSDGIAKSIDQSSIILPMDSNIYYVINSAYSDTSVDNDYSICDYLLYHKVDMNANAGAGKVVKRLQVLDHGIFNYMGLTACRHANGKDWWVIKPGLLDATFNTYLLTKDSFTKKNIQIFSLSFTTQGIYGSGQLMFNNEGTKLLYVYSHYLSGISVYDFDRCTGTISNPKYIFSPSYNLGPNNGINMLGGCFSPSGRYIYLSNVGRIWQYDLQSTDSATAWYQVAGYDTTGSQFAGYGNIFQAPNGRLYISSYDGKNSALSAINQPDSLQSACQFCPLCLRVDTIANGGTLNTIPNMPNYNLGASSVPCYPEGTSQLGISNYNIKVFPNPSNGIINVEYKFDKTAEFNVYNLVGQLLYTTTLPVERDKKQINLFNLKTGIYTYQILQNGRVVKTGKLTLVN